MYERLLDKSVMPTPEQLAKYCGEGSERFQAFNAWLSDEYQTQRELRFPYGKSYGWSVTHRRGKKLVCDVFAEAGAFTVMLRLSDKQYMKVYPKLLDYTREYIDHRYPCGDGGWIHYRVLSREQLEDVKKLMREKLD